MSRITARMRYSFSAESGCLNAANSPDSSGCATGSTSDTASLWRGGEELTQNADTHTVGGCNRKWPTMCCSKLLQSAAIAEQKPRMQCVGSMTWH